MYEQNLALNNLQSLVSHKTQPNNIGKEMNSPYPHAMS